MEKGIEKNTIGQSEEGGQRRNAALKKAHYGVEQGCPTGSHIFKCARLRAHAHMP
jgi:hypothetical protein